MLSTRSITSNRRGICPKSTRLVSRHFDDVLFKEGEMEKHPRRILTMIPRPATTIPQVAPGCRRPATGMHVRCPRIHAARRALP